MWQFDLFFMRGKIRGALRKSMLCFSILLCTGYTFGALIKSGNVLNITVQAHPEFSGLYTVSENGTVEYPLLSDQVVTNMNIAELMNMLTYKLARHIENPLVFITIVEKPKIAVTVLGEVVTAGVVDLYEGASIQEAMQRCGGPTKNADLHKIKVIHKRDIDLKEEYFDLIEFMKTGTLENTPRLSDKDVILVLSAQKTKNVKIIGAVNKPGLIDLQDQITIFELIYLAGGPAEKADLTRVRRLNRDIDTTTEEIINVQSYINRGKMDNIPLVHQGDIVIVYSRWFDWKSLMSIASNLLLFIVTIQSLRGAVSK